MAALTLSPANPIRQPFADLSAPRMRSMMRAHASKKNQQLSLAKPALPDLDDAENIDPSTRGASKRKRGPDDDEENSPVKTPLKSSKSSRIALTTVPSTNATPTRLPATPTPPKSAPVLKPAGRSPQSKPARPFARRANTSTNTRNVSKPRPTPAGRKSVAPPFSLATALGSKKTNPSSSPPKTPASWQFDIYVDSEQEEMTNLMQHSTGVLDISDEEGKVEAPSAGRGKENVPPAELGLDLPRPSVSQRESPAAEARKSVMQEESRAPLGDLHAADYYGEGCHAFSYEVVEDDENDDEQADEKKAASVPRPTLAHARAPSKSKLSSVSSISSLLEATAPKPEEPQPESKQTEPEPAEIEIWESGSAAEEAADAESS